MSSAAATGTSSAPSVPPDMLVVSGGEFTMGADAGGEPDERPAHRVTLAAFFLDRLETTNAEYLECVAAGRCKPWRNDVAQGMHLGPESRFRGPRQPVVGVSWHDAVGYCTFRDKRLPTEAEWERAARGDDDRRFPWGNDAPDKRRHGCFSGCAKGDTMDVGSYADAPGPYGHLDLAGNVWEWTASLYDPDAYRRNGATRGEPGTCAEILATQDRLRREGKQGYTGSNPIPNECERVLRGGAFNYSPPGLRVTNRVHHPASFRILVAGFRCARDAK
jgi:formylglycine-generating enzyme required for sulfatase activity